MLYFSTDLWGCGETAVEKPVENVENCEFPTDIFLCGKFQGCVKNALPTFTIPPSANTGLFSARGWQKAQPGAIAQKRFAFSPVFFLRLPFFPREAKNFCEFHQIFRRMVFSSPGDTKEALIKSARAGSERFCSRARYGKRGNTACTRKEYAASVSQLALATAALYFPFFVPQTEGKRSAVQPPTIYSEFP